MQDPYFAVKEEVEHSMTVVFDLHKRWQDLSESGKKTDEWEWTASELLSGLRSIEWDLQDLEDTVSIVEGNRAKFQLEEHEVQERKEFITSTRNQIVVLRDEVQGAALSPGFSTAKKGPKMPSIGSKSKGYGKVGSQDDTIEMPASDMGDIERGAGGSGAAPQRASNEDDILGADTDGGVAVEEPSRGRHRKKKVCLGLSLLLLIAGGAAAAVLSGGASGAGGSMLPPAEAAEVPLTPSPAPALVPSPAPDAARRRVLLRATADAASSANVVAATAARAALATSSLPEPTPTPLA